MLAALMERGECSAGDLGRPFAISQPSASQHLRVLEAADLVARRVKGRTHLFRLTPQPLDEAREWIDRHRELWQASLDRLDDLIEDIQRGKGHGV